MQFEVEFIREGPCQLWASEPFAVKVWWVDAPQVAEKKGDELGIGYWYKLDLPGRCWVTWEGTTGAVRNLSVVEALTNMPPSPQHALIYSGINTIEFLSAEPEPTPGPEPPPEPVPVEPPAPETPIQAVVIWRRNSVPLIVKDGLSIAVEDDLFKGLLSQIAQVIGTQQVRDDIARREGGGFEAHFGERG